MTAFLWVYLVRQVIALLLQTHLALASLGHSLAAEDGRNNICTKFLPKNGIIRNLLTIVVSHFFSMQTPSQTSSVT